MYDLCVFCRYDYRGVIYGWDATCQAEESWIASMGVDRLRFGRQQPFYRVLLDERDRRATQSTYGREGGHLTAGIGQLACDSWHGTAGL